MANVQLKDGAGATKYTKATGAGTDNDPYIVEHKETSASAIATSAASIDTKTPALGQALAAASVPVILPAATITTLTPPAAITGFATSANQTTANTALAAVQTAVEIMDDWDESDRAKVNPIVGQAGVAANTGTVSATTQRVTLATDVALPTGTNTIGNTKDAGPSWTSVFGVSGARYTSSDRSGSAASITDAPTSGQKIVVTDVLISVDTAMRVDLKEQTSGTVIASLYLSANGSAQFTPRGKLKLATADKTLQVQTSAAGNIAVTAFYYSEA